MQFFVNIKRNALHWFETISDDFKNLPKFVGQLKKNKYLFCLKKKKKKQSLSYN